MSTNSSITVKVNDKVKTIYCHYDGYPDYNGRLLLDHYNSQELAETVISIGDLSKLGENMNAPDGHTYETPVKDCSIAYGRDRGEENTETLIYSDYNEALSKNTQEYNYYWDGEKWLVDSTVLTREFIESE